MDSTITILCTALCGQQGGCEIDKLRASVVSAKIGMECRQSNVSFGLVIDLGRLSASQLVRALVDDKGGALS